MMIPQELKYTKTHEWVKFAGDSALVGLTDYAQRALGDIVFISLPEVGDEVTAGETFTDLESVKAISDLYAPVSGTVAAVNEELLDNSALINENPYGAWIIRVSPYTAGDDLYDAATYQKIVEEEEA